MANEGFFNMVVDGKGVNEFTQALTDFITKGKQDSNYELATEDGYSFKVEDTHTGEDGKPDWVISRYKDGVYECFSACPTDEELKVENGAMKYRGRWRRDVAIYDLCKYLAKQHSAKIYYLGSCGCTMLSNDMEQKYFKDDLAIVDYIGSEYDVDGWAPEGWDNEWDDLTLEDRKALCDKYGFAYATVEFRTDNIG